MKKFLAIVFALIFALSACTVAFAADATFTTTCKYCEKVFTDANTYNDHLDACKKEANAEDPTENTKHVCQVCATVFPNRTEYMAHMNGGCLVAYKTCPYCESIIDDAAIEAHKKICPKGARGCDYCFDDFGTQGEFDDHLDACKEKFFNIPVSKIVNTIVNFLKGVDWGSLLGKIGDLFKGIDIGAIFDKIGPLFEKIPGLFEKLPGLIEGLGK